jgi:transcriptional regulator with XRE-family HTH domain
MTHPPYLRNKAIQMRTEQRMTLDEIAERLALSKTTVWSWIKDLHVAPAPSRGREIQSPKAVAKRAESIRATWAARRQKAYEEGLAEYDELIAEPGFRDFLCLYVGEGYKRSRNTVAIANSDPAVIALANYWLRRLATRELKYEFQYHADQDVDALKSFWASRLGIEVDVVKAIPKSNSGQLRSRTWRCRWGVLAVSAHETYLRSRLQAWLDRLKEGWLHSVHGV